ncbi:MAG: photosystem II assembly family protein, partial [Cyanobacteria bacterium J06633_1]
AKLGKSLAKFCPAASLARKTKAPIKPDAGQNLANDLPNFALQVGVVALMVFLFRIDQPRDKTE